MIFVWPNQGGDGGLSFPKRADVHFFIFSSENQSSTLQKKETVMNAIDRVFTSFSGKIVSYGFAGRQSKAFKVKYYCSRTIENSQ